MRPRPGMRGLVEDGRWTRLLELSQNLRLPIEACDVLEKADHPPPIYAPLMSGPQCHLNINKVSRL